MEVPIKGQEVKVTLLQVKVGQGQVILLLVVVNVVGSQ